jgi:thiopurine S-methyltransferase
MDHDFWHGRWARNDIHGFHGPLPNALLVAHFPTLAVPAGGRVFVPLCGKTRDIHWLLAQGHRVVGAELSELAVRQLFSEVGFEPAVHQLGELSRYSGPGIDILVGDIFQVTRDLIGPVDAIYDRAALVALPESMRARYAEHVQAITDAVPQLLLCFVYDQTALAGPPFAIGDGEVQRHYASRYRPELLASEEMPDGLKGLRPVFENVWLLKR